MSETPTTPAEPPPLRSVHTTSFPAILAEFSASVLVTTYQAGKLVVLRNDGGVLNTHFRDFAKPMGLALAGSRLAIGTATEILEFHNVPEACIKLDADDRLRRTRHDACFMPRRSHTTGDVAIHEMAWIDGEMWFVNTAFSCLATRSDANSFDPRWWPPFITELSPGDACHLNGLAVRDGRAAFVTALGRTAAAGGWREAKRDGGVVLDVASGEIVAAGLAMPHSPRWHRGELWVLESGDGSIGRVDLRTGRYEAVARLPGFTRGMSLIGALAFVGLSQVRESAIFSGIPLVERLQERGCGVWAVNIDSGETAGFVRFEEAVQEVFAVEALAGMRYPDVINNDAELIGRTYVLSDEALKLVPAGLRSEGTG